MILWREAWFSESPRLVGALLDLAGSRLHGTTAMEHGPFGYRQGAGVDIADKAGLAVEPDFLGANGAANDAVDVDVAPFEMRVGLTRLADREGAGAGQLSLEGTVDPNAVVDLHHTLKDRPASDDGVELAVSSN